MSYFIYTDLVFWSDCCHSFGDSEW